MTVFTQKKILRSTLLVFSVWLLGSYAGSIIVTYPRHAEIPEASAFFPQTVEEQRLVANDGVEIVTWYLPCDSKKAVIILNGIGANRAGLVSRAKFYQQNSYNVVIPDLRGTGESGGDVVAFGWQERLDLKACVDFLKTKGMESIAVHGFSLGAAAIAYSFHENPDYEFVVLESCYGNLKKRIDRFPFSSFFTYAFVEFTELRIGVESKQLCPEDFIKKCKFPTFIMAGDSERKIKTWETEKLFNNCGAATKHLYFFRGGRHENFLDRFESEWKEQMGNWLNRFNAN